MKRKILLVDDDEGSIQPLLEELQKDGAILPRWTGFHQFDAVLEDFAPHIVILDLAEGNPSDQQDPGLAAFDEIWKRRFCPLIFYTAVPELLEGDERVKDHPFVKIQKKGSGSEQQVVDHVREFGPFVSSLQNASGEIERSLNIALRDTAQRVFENGSNQQERNEMLVRSVRRRVAASMDTAMSTGGPVLRSWEHYICPPIDSGSPRTGDILRTIDGKENDPSQYFVVLTASCDMVAEQDRPPKVKNVLVAACTGVERFLTDVNLNPKTPVNKLKDKLPPALRQGYGRSCLPLPALPYVFPVMVADFRNLELIALDEIGEGRRYLRVASVDNPFRGLVSWAYMTNAARPGLPERDCEGWAEDMIQALPKQENNGAVDR